MEYKAMIKWWEWGSINRAGWRVSKLMQLFVEFSKPRGKPGNTLPMQWNYTVVSIWPPQNRHMSLLGNRKKVPSLKILWPAVTCRFTSLSKTNGEVSKLLMSHWEGLTLAVCEFFLQLWLFLQSSQHRNTILFDTCIKKKKRETCIRYQTWRLQKWCCFAASIRKK